MMGLEKGTVERRKATIVKEKRSNLPRTKGLGILIVIDGIVPGLVNKLERVRQRK
jgi:hypothetical protein